MGIPLRFALCTAALLLTGMAKAQFDPGKEMPGKEGPPVRRLGTGFERNINTYQWDLNGVWEERFGPWRLSASERFRRSLILTDREYVTDEHRAYAQVGYALSKEWTLTTDLSSYGFVDNRSTVLNDLTGYGLLAGVVWQPWDFLAVSPRIGYIMDSQRGTRDEGLAWQALFSLNQPNAGIHQVVVTGYLGAEELVPRSHYERRLTGSVRSVFSEAGTNVFQVTYRGLKRDVYIQTTATEVESRREDLVQAGDQITYSISSPLSLTASGDLSWRSISRERPGSDYDVVNPFFASDVEELRLTLRGALKYEGKDGSLLEVRTEWFERPEEHQVRRGAGVSDMHFLRYQKLEEQKNNTISQTNLSLHALVPASRDTLAVQATVVKMRYDSPSQLNYDDRDELLYLAGATWSHRFSPTVTASLAGDLAFRHTVYVYSQRSANNTWNRVLRLSPAVQYQAPGRLTSRLQTEVLANYTVYDFEKRNPSLGSYYLRQVSLADSSTLSLSRDVELRVWLLLRVYERGAMRWEDFTVQPASLFDERSAAFECAWVRPGWSIAAGFRFFQQLQSAFSEGDWRRRGHIRTLGPTCRCSIGNEGGLSLSIEGWYQFHSTQSGEVKTTPNIAMNVLWNL